MAVTVYAKPACVQCNATYKALDKRGIAYEKVDITRDSDARDYVMALGYLQAPVVVAGGEHWSGYKPDRLAALRQLDCRGATVTACALCPGPTPPDTINRTALAQCHPQCIAEVFIDGRDGWVFLADVDAVLVHPDLEARLMTRLDSEPIAGRPLSTAGEHQPSVAAATAQNYGAGDHQSGVQINAPATRLVVS